MLKIAIICQGSFAILSCDSAILEDSIVQLQIRYLFNNVQYLWEQDKLWRFPGGSYNDMYY